MLTVIAVTNTVHTARIMGNVLNPRRGRRNNMIDPFKNYDRWKLMSPEDEIEERERKERVRQREEDMADEMYDRAKDERDEPYHNEPE